MTRYFITFQIESLMQKFDVTTIMRYNYLATTLQLHCCRKHLLQGSKFLYNARQICVQNKSSKTDQRAGNVYISRQPYKQHSAQYICCTTTTILFEDPITFSYLSELLSFLLNQPPKFYTAGNSRML